MYELIIQSSKFKRTVCQVNGGEITLGRLKENNIVLEHGSASREHAVIHYDHQREKLFIRDNGSTNGTFVNGKKLEEEKELEHNDQIRIGIYIISVVNKAATTSLPVSDAKDNGQTDQALEILIQAVDHFAVLLHDLSLEIFSTPDFPEALECINNFILQMLDADDCKVILQDEIETFLREIKKHKALDKVVSKRLPVIYRDDQVLADGSIIETSNIMVPVIHNREISALLYVRNFGPNLKDFEAHDLQLVVGVSHQTALLLQQQKHQEELIHNATHDAITGLPNRQYLNKQLSLALARSKRHEDYGFALFFIDIDNFKIINDSLGHLVGDELLAAFAERMKNCVREVDTIARFGGDEFAILYDGVNDLEEILLIGQRVVEQMTKPYTIQGKELVMQISIGITYDSLGYEAAEEIIRDADIAMYQAKEQDEYDLKIFDQSMHDHLVELLQLQTKLRAAYKKEEFLLNYQPIIDLRAGTVIGLEALIRWHSPEKGVITPEQFINFIDSSGLQSSLEYWVLETACSQVSHMNEMLSRDYFVSVNLSERQIRHPNLMDAVAEVLRKYNMHSDRLWLEVTEQSNITNMERAISVFQAFQSMGIRLCLDDFGTGYSTLSYLYTFPMDILKIDKSFVHRVLEHEESAKVVRTIIGLAHNLGLKVVAEGVETTGQLEFLRETECDYVQGYLFSRPQGADEIVSLLVNNPKW
ncbi:EAL domain-containing protein [bacterium]|nr:EAL domain-containing protein [bacterium]MCB2178988.1 EAL domain-containing protein [bacterium]